MYISNFRLRYTRCKVFFGLDMVLNKNNLIIKLNNLRENGLAQVAASGLLIRFFQ